MSVDSLGERPAVASSALEKKAQVKDDGHLYIGDVAMQAKYQGKIITDQQILGKIASLLNKHYEMSEIYTALFSTSAKAGKMQIAKEGIHVISQTQTSEPSMKDQITTRRKEIRQGEAVKEHFSERFESLENRLLQKQQFTGTLKVLDSFPPQVVANAIENILEEPHTNLEDYLEGNFESQGALGAVSKSVGDLLHEPGNEGLHAALVAARAQKESLPEVPTSGSKKLLEECEVKLRNILLDTMQRNPKAIRLPDGSMFVQTFERGIAHPNLSSSPVILEANFRKLHHAVPSQLDTKEGRAENPEIAPHNTNLGSVALYDAQGNIVRVIATRSGRSDSPERLQEAAIDALLTQLQSKDRVGLSRGAGGVLEFRHEITSHLDLGRAKGSKEKEELDAILKAQDAWPVEGYKIKVAIDGKEETVILKKPLIRSQSLSALAEGTPLPLTSRKISLGSGLDEAFRFNFVSNQQCFMRYLDRYNVADLYSLKRHSGELNELLKNRLNDDAGFLTSEGFIDFDKVKTSLLYEEEGFFNDERYKDYMRAVGEVLLKEIETKQTEGAPALYTMLFHRVIPLTLEGLYDCKLERQALKKRDELFKRQEIQASDLEIYSHIVYDALNVSCGKQCKSGKDRTPIGYSLKVAQSRFLLERGYEFVPTKAEKNPADLQLFKTFYRDALGKFGFEVTVESYGYAGLKWASGITDNNTGLQYMPTVEAVGEKRRRREILGKTRKKTLKGAQSAQKSLFTDPLLMAQAKSAKVEVEKFLRGKLLQGVLGQLDPILTDSLELMPHVRKLKLNEKVQGKTRHALIQEKIDNLKVQRNNAEQALERVEQELDAKLEELRAEGVRKPEEDARYKPHKAAFDENQKVVNEFSMQIYALSRILQLSLAREEAKLTLNRVAAAGAINAQSSINQDLTLERQRSQRIATAARKSLPRGG